MHFPCPFRNGQLPSGGSSTRVRPAARPALQQREPGQHRFRTVSRAQRNAIANVNALRLKTRSQLVDALA